MSQPDYHYCGDELSIFAHAVRWKARLAAEIRPYLGERVLEVGAGIGETTRALISDHQTSWTLLEPDPALAGSARALISNGTLREGCEVEVGTVETLAPTRLFDSVIYIDVLEHIEQDAHELDLAARHLAPSGHLVVLSPAHQWLYSPFDERIGHVRRYSRRSLLEAGPSQLRLVRVRYLDAVGLLASLANRVLLRQSLPTREQVLTWDRRLVPLSAFVDPWLGYRVGKSILAIWQRKAN